MVFALPQLLCGGLKAPSFSCEQSLFHDEISHRLWPSRVLCYPIWIRCDAFQKDGTSQNSSLNLVSYSLEHLEIPEVRFKSPVDSVPRIFDVDSKAFNVLLNFKGTVKSTLKNRT